MKIRKIKQTDESQLLALIYKFYIEYNRQKLFSKELLELEAYKNIEKVMRNTAKRYIHNKKYLVFVAEKDKKLTGYICGQIKSRPNKIFNKEGYIEDWFVDETYRNQKIGKSLFNILVNKFKKKNCTHIATDAYFINKYAINIYHKLGFMNYDLKLIKKI